MEKASRRKFFRYTGSGILVAVVGILVIIYGFALREGAYSPEGLIIGIGAIIVIVGIVRVLIGLIKPSTPADLRYVVRAEDLDPNDNDHNDKNDKPIPLDQLTYQDPVVESDGV